MRKLSIFHLNESLKDIGQLKAFYLLFLKFMIWFLKKAQKKYSQSMMKSVNMSTRMASGASRCWFISDNEKGLFYKLAGGLAVDNKAYNMALKMYDISFPFLKGLPEEQLEVSRMINWIWQEQARLEAAEREIINE